MEVDVESFKMSMKMIRSYTKDNTRIDEVQKAIFDAKEIEKTSSETMAYDHLFTHDQIGLENKRLLNLSLEVIKNCI